jgi:hypothetical protein
VDLVYGAWTGSIAGWRSSSELVLWPLRGLRPPAKGRGGVGGGGVALRQLDEPLTRARAAVRWLGDREGRWRPKSHGGGCSGVRGKARMIVSGEVR